MEVSETKGRAHTTNPPFPNDVPTAPLLQLSLKKLLQNDTEESTSCFQACKNLGFFYLDLRGTTVGESLLDDADRLFDVGEQLFELDLEEKQRYDFSGQQSYYGYDDYH